MAISSVCIGNFKGFRNEEEIKLYPITVIVGANSSGKSSLIHSLAALAQTARVTKDSRPLVLDDDNAYVHLGRFIEVIHSKSYQDLITLGIGVDSVRHLVLDEKGRHKAATAPGSWKVGFKCTKRTQEIAIEKGQFEIGKFGFDLSKSKKNYLIKNRGTGEAISTTREAGFTFDINPSPLVRGGNPIPFFPFRGLQTQVTRELRSTLYLGPFRQPPARRYATRGASPTEVGAMGEAAVTLLANEAIQSRSRPHAKQIHKWLQELGLAKSLDVARIGTSDLFDVVLELPGGGVFPLADLGYGLSQILPVLVQCSFAPNNSTLLFEQPEIHLHTLSSRKLAAVFRETVRQKSASIILETHSPELVKQFFSDIRSGVLKKDEFGLYRISREGGCSSIRLVDVGTDGDVYDNWENGISIA